MRESSGIAPGILSLPSGGGGVAPQGERFQPDLTRGSGSYAVPLNVPRGPGDLRPELRLTYSTGSGNGPFGLGWRLGPLRVERRTDRGVPTYGDPGVRGPIPRPEADQFVLGDAEVLVDVGAGRYRPQTDSRFWHVERLEDGWRLRTGDGRTLEFGRTDASRERDGARVFSWHLDSERDAAGNTIAYTYRRDGGRLYLDEVRWSIFRLRVVYEDRPDALRSGRSGFLRLTALRAAAIELHCDRLDPTLMRTHRLGYTQAAGGASLLTRLELEGTADGETAHAPDLTFTYAEARFDRWQVHEPQALVAPPGLDDPSAQLVDLDGDGLPDVLQTAGRRMLRWTNRGDGWFDGPVSVGAVPSTVSLARGNVAFADLNGNGRADLFAVDQPLALAFEADGRGGFAPEPVVFRQRPQLRLDAPDTRLMDTDGDGVTDLIATGRRQFLLYRHDPGAGWQDPVAITRTSDLERFPDVTLADPHVRLADMTGDGLADLVLLRGRELSYWPYLGHGRWGERVVVRNAPRLPPGYRAERLHLVDVDGDGCADVVYADHDRVLVWLNGCGAAFADPVEVPVAAGTGAVLPADLFGDGRPGLAWTATARGEFSTGWRFLRFDGGRKPYLMTAIDNGLGGRTEMQYTTSAALRRDDAARGRPWSGQLPVSVQVVRRIVERDAVSGRETSIEISYRDGVYDGPRREFRGFGAVTVDASGDESVPATRQETTFHQGDPEHPDPAERDRQRALAGALVATRTLEASGDGFVARQSATQRWEVRVEHDGPGGRVFAPLLTEIEAREHSPTGAPDRVERTRLSGYDAHGNAGRRERASFADGEPEDEWLRSEERFTYTANIEAWLVRLPVRLELRDGDGLPFAVKVTRYDGPAFEGLPEGEVERGLVTREQELHLLEARLPDGYADHRDLEALGFALTGAGDTRGYYATTTAHERDSAGSVMRYRDQTGGVLTVAFDADGLYPVTVTDVLGRATALEFEPRAGEPRRVDLPDGRRIRYEHDALGRLVATHETDEAGVEQLVKCWVLDLVGTPPSATSLAPAAGGRDRAELVAPGIDLAALEGVSVSRVYYDGFGNEALQVTTAPDGPGGERRFVASSAARLNAKALAATLLPPGLVDGLAFAPLTVPADSEVRYRYDGLGQVVETAGPGPVHHRVERDTFTIRHFHGAAAGADDAAPDRVERYDARARLVAVTEDAAGAVPVSTVYDLAVDGRVTAVRDGDGAATVRYWIAGPTEPVRIEHRDVGARTYYRDAAGRLVERSNADGSALHYAYDALGRLTRVEHAAAGSGARETVREIVYDTDPGAPSAGRFLDGRIALVREAGNEFRFSYNRAGLPVREEATIAGETLAAERSYDLQGHLEAITYPDGEHLALMLDRSGSVRSMPGVVDDIAYAPEGHVRSYRLANGLEVALPRDEVSRRLTEIAATRAGETLRRQAYTYDEVGNVTGLVDASGGVGASAGRVEEHAFRYDGLYRLTGYEVRDGDEVTRGGDYTYDADGNLLTLPEAGGLTLAYGDAARPGRLTAVEGPGGAQALAYDDLGRATSFGDASSIGYDAFDRVVRVEHADGTVLRFAYDLHDRRVLKEVTRAGSTTLTRELAGLYEQHADHAVRHVFVGRYLAASVRVAAEPGSQPVPLYFVCDELGSVLLVTDAAGKPVGEQRYTPFGAALDPGGGPERYLGRPMDAETGLLHLGARHYAPVIGRFVTPDWFVLENPDRVVRMPQGFNLYSYALNNPLVFRDPSGMWFLIDDAIVAAVGFVVGFVSGLVYGLANGQGWGSFLTALETGLTTAAGAWLGWNVGMLVGGPVGGFVGAAMGGMNGLVSGLHGIYDWTSVDGWFAFLSDSTWGLVGTSLGNVVHAINLFYSDSNYREDLSRRQNRHVYEGGFALKSDFAFTQGNVISNAGLGQGAAGINPSFIADHEELHIWQGRFFGPVFQATYVVWGVGGFVVASVYWLFNRDEDWWSLVETAAYYNNPFEYWAYRNDSNWPPSGANPALTWP